MGFLFLCIMKLFLFIFSCIILSCTNNSSSNQIKKFENDSIQFFQVSNFIQSQLDEIKKTPFFIYKKTINNGNEDSTVISSNELIEIANPFLNSDISNAQKKYYKESAFEDLTTKSITFNYSTSNPNLAIQNIDVLLHQETQKCKRIFIKKFFQSGDTTFNQQLNWKSNESFQIISNFSTSKNSKEQLQQTLVVWN